jgi:glycosyltransferase involved in cell wall biosynthesis
MNEAQDDARQRGLGPDRFAFVVPVYNHAGSVARVIEGLRAYKLPIFAVDDGSTDDSGAVLARLSDMVLLRHPENRGKGAALKTGMAAAARVADWAITIDADGQHDPKDAAALMDAARRTGRGIIVGNRLGMLGPNIPWTSRFGRAFSNFWVQSAGGPVVDDTQSGFRVYPLPEVFRWGASAKRFQYEVEILVRAHWNGMPVREVDISVKYAPKGERISHFRPWVDFWRNSAIFTGLIVRRVFVPIQGRRRVGPPDAGRD